MFVADGSVNQIAGLVPGPGQPVPWMPFQITGESFSTPEPYPRPGPLASDYVISETDLIALLRSEGFFPYQQPVGPSRDLYLVTTSDGAVNDLAERFVGNGPEGPYLDPPPSPSSGPANCPDGAGQKGALIFS
jgi:hypothetical protein